MRPFRHVFADLVRQHDDTTRDRHDAIVFRETVGHHVAQHRARLGPVKAFRSAPTPDGADGLDRHLARATDRPWRDGRAGLRPHPRKEITHA
jgi:hypothetical protein